MNLHFASTSLVLLVSSGHTGAADETPRVRTRDHMLDTPSDSNAGRKPASRGRGFEILTPQAIPSVDRAKVEAEDAERNVKDLPQRFAIPNQVNVDPSTDGTWSTAEDGTQIWQHRVKSPGCNSLNFGFGVYDMPENGSLHIYDTKGRVSIARPFTSEDNSKAQQLWTPVIESCDVAIEVNLAPSTSKEDLKLSLTSVNVGYRGFGTRSENEHGQPRRKLSGSCNIDVVCPQGDGWEAEISSVAVYSRGGGFICTGAMINNTNEDGTPFFLTADHCGITSSNAHSLVTYWNFQSSECGSIDGQLNQFTTGAQWKFSNYASDCTLVELNSIPDPAFQVAYAGWDKTGINAETAIAIHHPDSDEKRISFEYDRTSVSDENGNASGDTHVRVADWDLGTTEPGSSGSPLFDQDHHIIGQLWGGGAACGNNLPDYYGRLSKSWEAGLRYFLDPGGTGAGTMDTFCVAGCPTASPTISPAPTVTPTTQAPTNSPTTQESCLNQPTNVAVQVNVWTDNYPGETSWSLKNMCNEEVKTDSGYTSQGSYSETIMCLPKSMYQLTMSDDYGDGLCCGYGEGNYTVLYGTTQVHYSNGEFLFEDVTDVFGEASCEVFGTAAPTTGPTSYPTGSPTISFQPTKKPTTSPTEKPTKMPTPPPTPLPTSCSLAAVGDSCVDHENCCSGKCSRGKKNSRVCLAA